MSLFHTEPNPTDTSTAKIPVRNADGSPASYTPDELIALVSGGATYNIGGETVAVDDPRILCNLVAQKGELLDVQMTTTSGAEVWLINGVAQAPGINLSSTVAVGDALALFAPGGSSDITSIDAWANSKLQGDISKLLDGGNITSVTISGNNKMLSADVNPLFLKSPVVTYACNGLGQFTFNTKSIKDGVSAGTLVTLNASSNSCTANLGDLNAVATLTRLGFSYCPGVVYSTLVAPTHNADMFLNSTSLSSDVYGIEAMFTGLLAAGYSGATIELKGGVVPSSLIAANKAALEAAGNTVIMYVL